MWDIPGEVDVRGQLRRLPPDSSIGLGADPAGQHCGGHSLAGQLDQVARLTGRPVSRAYVDRGYRGRGLRRDGPEVVLSHSRGIASPTIRREMRRRNALELVPVCLSETASSGRKATPYTPSSALSATGSLAVRRGRPFGITGPDCIEDKINPDIATDAAVPRRMTGISPSRRT
jgi:hypothetical protein